MNAFLLLLLLGVVLWFIIGYTRGVGQDKKYDEMVTDAKKAYENHLAEFHKSCEVIRNDLEKNGQEQELKLFLQTVEDTRIPMSPIDPIVPLMPKAQKILQEVRNIVREQGKKQESLKRLAAKEARWKQLRYEFEKLKMTRRFKQWVREQWECQHGGCAWCQKPIMMWGSRGTVVDHIKPLSYRIEEQGDNSYDNLILSCYRCNESKGDDESWVKPDWIVPNKFTPGFKAGKTLSTDGTPQIITGGPEIDLDLLKAIDAAMDKEHS